VDDGVGGLDSSLGLLSARSRPAIVTMMNSILNIKNDLSIFKKMRRDYFNFILNEDPKDEVRPVSA